MVRLIFFFMLRPRLKLLYDVDRKRGKMQAAGGHSSQGFCPMETCPGSVSGRRVGWCCGLVDGGARSLGWFAGFTTVPLAAAGFWNSFGLVLSWVFAFSCVARRLGG